ncbi:MAG: hypothetical protein OXN94_08815 [Chloroflexota bacterium]|nr:hypothetical protein [Chloroflexota bacterium]MDE2949367.1 hypothetical protein [Chloroflexota bacterium]
MAVRRSYTAIVERNVLWQGDFASEPYEAAWASEAIFFVRALDLSPDFEGGLASVQISADGIYWADEGTTFELPRKTDAVTFCKVTHFGGFLRLQGHIAPGDSIKVLVSLALKE